MFVKFLNGFQNFVSIDFWTVLFAWVNLLIVYLILKKLLFVPVKNMIDSRQKEIDDMYSEAEENKSSAKAMKEEYTEKLRAAEEEKDAILRDAVRKAQLREEEIIREANEKAARTMEKASEQIELERIKALNEVKDQVSETAIMIAEAVIKRDVNADEHQKLIDDFIREMGDN